MDRLKNTPKNTAEERGSDDPKVTRLGQVVEWAFMQIKQRFAQQHKAPAPDDHMMQHARGVFS